MGVRGHDGSELGHAAFWDRRYAQAATTEDGEKKPIQEKGHEQKELGDVVRATHEWLGDFEKLEGFLAGNMLEREGFRARDGGRVLHLGSGDSEIPARLAANGYQTQLCVDFSPVVVELMRTRHASVPGIEWHLLDVRAMGAVVADESVRVAFDKSTLDAMIYGSPWDPPDEVRERTGAYLREVHRVLENEGVFLYVTFRQTWFVRPLLDIDELWDLEMQTIKEEGAFEYFGWSLRKKKKKGLQKIE